MMTGGIVSNQTPFSASTYSILPAWSTAYLFLPFSTSTAVYSLKELYTSLHPLQGGADHQRSFLRIQEDPNCKE